MADEADMANAKMEMELEFLVRTRMKEPPQEGGTCLYCGAELPGSLRFCPPEDGDDWSCRDDYEKYAL